MAVGVGGIGVSVGVGNGVMEVFVEVENGVGVYVDVVEGGVYRMEVGVGVGGGAITGTRPRSPVESAVPFSPVDTQQLIGGLYFSNLTSNHQPSLLTPIMGAASPLTISPPEIG